LRKPIGAGGENAIIAAEYLGEHDEKLSVLDEVQRAPESSIRIV
jgi:hypothetical protein